VRNFCIIAHVDHGKSTLADRILELTGAVSPERMVPQFLDRLDLERERGITIKAQAVRLRYRALDGREYQLNLIDTPGHVDFTYEVSRSLAACEGAVLLVDATQGVEAQTVSNLYLALEQDLEIIPAINKIDLPNADPERVRQELAALLGSEGREALLVSAKEGTGVRELLEAVVKRVPPPRGDPQEPLQALIIDSWYDPYRGAVVLVRVFQGRLRPGMQVVLLSTGKRYEVNSVGVFAPLATPVEELSAGQVGFLAAGIKEVRDARMGDTVAEAGRPVEPLPGFKPLKPMVFCGLYPASPVDYEVLRGTLERFHLNDWGFSFEPESSALGVGFRCGFLGTLHMEIVRERLEREFGLELIATAPTVSYEVLTTDGQILQVRKPSELPPPQRTREIREPYVLATVHTPSVHLGEVMRLCEERRGRQRSLEYLSKGHAMVTYEIPLNEIIWDFYDRLKSLSRGYASLDYDLLDWRPSDLVRLDILVAGQPLDALSVIVPRQRAYQRGRELVRRLREVIPRQLFEVAIQAAIGGRVIARENIPPLRKHVTAKCYGGDVTRKRKLLERQKEGKKRLKAIGRVEIPQEAFMAVLEVR